MNNTNDSHYLLASYTSSKEDYFPNNRADKFHIHFPKPLALEGARWKVAICELHFENIDHRTAAKTPVFYRVELSNADGILIDGVPTRCIRTVFPKQRESHILFDPLYYFPVNTKHIDTCLINLHAYTQTERVLLPLKDKSNIYFMFHFKKCR